MKTFSKIIRKIENRLFMLFYNTIYKIIFISFCKLNRWVDQKLTVRSYLEQFNSLENTNPHNVISSEFLFIDNPQDKRVQLELPLEIETFYNADEKFVKTLCKDVFGQNRLESKDFTNNVPIFTPSFSEGGSEFERCQKIKQKLQTLLTTENI